MATEIEKVSREHLTELFNAIVTNNQNKVHDMKYTCLFDGTNLFDIVVNYVFLSDTLVDFDFGFDVIKKGTTLYRIRRYLENVDFSNPKQWQPAPTRPENRCNLQGEEALYVATDEIVCLLETHIKKGEKYVLAQYEVTEDIIVGGFISFEKHNAKQFNAGRVLNAALIAPSRSDINDSLFLVLEEKLGNIGLYDMSLKDDILLPFKFALLNKKNDSYHGFTNKLCAQLKKKYPDGIRYSSCYLPLETPGISSNYHNYVLYKSSLSKLQFLRYQIKVCEQGYSVEELALILLKVYENAKEKN